MIHQPKTNTPPRGNVPVLPSTYPKVFETCRRRTNNQQQSEARVRWVVEQARPPARRSTESRSVHHAADKKYNGDKFYSDRTASSQNFILLGSHHMSFVQSVGYLIMLAVKMQEIEIFLRMHYCIKSSLKYLKRTRSIICSTIDLYA